MRRPEHGQIDPREAERGDHYFVPLDSDYGTRLLDALFTFRPALRDVPPPVAGAFAAQRAFGGTAFHDPFLIWL